MQIANFKETLGNNCLIYMAPVRKDWNFVNNRNKESHFSLLFCFLTSSFKTHEMLSVFHKVIFP